MIEGLIVGETDPAELARRADPRLRASPEELRHALHRRVAKPHRFLLALHFRQIDAIDGALEAIDREVDNNIAPFRTAVQLLATVPGVKGLAARTIMSEVGTDMSRFPTDGHLRSWAGFCPKSDESAGKRRSTRMRKGAPWLKATLLQCAWAAARTKGSYFQAQFHRLMRRRGSKKAACAVAAAILTTAHHMLRNGTLDQDLGADYFHRNDKAAQTNRLVKRLRNLGYTIELSTLAA